MKNFVRLLLMGALIGLFVAMVNIDPDNRAAWHWIYVSGIVILLLVILAERLMRTKQTIIEYPSEPEPTFRSFFEVRPRGRKEGWVFYNTWAAKYFRERRQRRQGR